MLWIVTDAERASPLDFGPYAVLDNRGATMCSHPIWIRQWRALRCARYRRRPPGRTFPGGSASATEPIPGGLDGLVQLAIWAAIAREKAGSRGRWLRSPTRSRAADAATVTPVA